MGWHPVQYEVRHDGGVRQFFFLVEAREFAATRTYMGRPCVVEILH
jgi:hypothetical protein